MEPKDVVDREAQNGRSVGVVGLIGVAAILAASFGGLASDFRTADGAAEQLERFEGVASEFLASQVLLAIGTLLLIAPLVYLFQAALRRSPAMRRGLIGLTVIAPIFAAASYILSYFAFDSAATVFADNATAAADLDEVAQDTLVDQEAYGIFAGLRFASLLGMVFALVYTSLHAMRVGLLTRFNGTFGMALGVGFLLLGPLSFAVWGLMMSLLIAGWWRGPRPPAWETGEAIPWPKPGEEEPPMPEEPARPEDFEGSARELDGDASPDENGGGERPGRRDNRRKRKRKQRR